MSATKIAAESQDNNAAFPRTPEARLKAGGQSWKIERRKFTIPSGFVPLQIDDEGLAGVEVWRDPTLPIAAGFAGKRARPDWYFRFRDEARMHECIAEWLQRLHRAEQQKTARRAEKKAQIQAGHGCKIGDVFCCSWGYEQTNIDYFEVVALHGKTMATVREICAEYEASDYLQGRCIPVPGSFVAGKEHQKVRINPGNPPYFKAFSFANAYLLKQRMVAGVRIFDSSFTSSYY